jgi:hypothetical protein
MPEYFNKMIRINEIILIFMLKKVKIRMIKVET